MAIKMFGIRVEKLGCGGEKNLIHDGNLIKIFKPTLKIREISIFS